MLKNKIAGMISKANSYRSYLDELLHNDEDLALMNLKLLRNQPVLYCLPLVDEILNSHEQIEVLLESYLIDYNTLESKLKFLQAQLHSAEESVLLRLDTSRNQLLTTNTVIG